MKTFSLVIRYLWVVFAFAACMQAHADLSPNGTVILPGSDVYPESMAEDTRTGKLFVGSFYKGNVLEFYKGKHRVFVSGVRDDIHSVTGLAVDSGRRRLWLCNSDAGASTKTAKESIGKSYVHVYNVDNGELIKKISLNNVKGGHFCNDIALSSDGSAYITDSFSPIIWKVNRHFKAQAWLVSDKFKGKGFNLNGIQLTPDEKYLIVDKMNSGFLFRVGTQDKSLVKIKFNRTLEGGDGMQLVSPHELLVVEGFGAKHPGIAKLKLNNDYTAVVSEGKVVSKEFDVPTAVRKVGSSIYIVNSRFYHLFKRDTYGPAKGPFDIVRFDLHKPMSQGAF